MSFGKMNQSAQIVEKQVFTDSEGFPSVHETAVADAWVYREGRHGSVRWANLAAFSEATDLFRMRKIPHVQVTPDKLIVLGNERFEILSVENVKGRGMYLEILAKKVVPVHG
nr:MAG TPA: head tail joining protein [Caudoviricetes sp.]